MHLPCQWTLWNLMLDTTLEVQHLKEFLITDYRTWIIVENVFGILSGKVRVFSKPVARHPNKTETVALTCTYVHNFPCWNITSRNFYSPHGTCNLEDTYNHTIIPGFWKSETKDKHGFLSLQNVPRSSLNVAKSISNRFREYFISTEEWVSWQYMYIKLLIHFVD